LPISAAQREFIVKVDGEVLGRGEHLLALSINSTINRIASARLVYQDGSAAGGEFRLSGSGKFVPGVEVEIQAGTSDEPITLFKGIVVRHALKIRESSAPQLVVECRHAAARMTVNANNAYFLEQSDSDVISALFEAAGISADVDATSVTHEQLVQYHATDWDFCQMRAEANGLVIVTRPDGLLVQAPNLTAEPVIDLQFGATIIEADLQLEARYQFSAVKSRFWDSASQEIVELDGADPGNNSPGNIASGDLAGVVGLDAYSLMHTQLAEDEAQAWADGQWSKSQSNRVNGCVKCEGIGSVAAGDRVRLAGVGDRFNGEAYVTAVRHDFDLVRGWKTWLQFGGIEGLSDAEKSPSATRAMGLLPAVNGLQIGIVVSNEDPQGESRVRVKMPLVDNDDDGTWARVASLDAGAERGWFIRPEIGDEVVLGFFDDDPRRPVVIGMLNSSARAAPLEGSDDNHEKVFQTRSKMKLHFDDDKVVMQLSTPAENRILLSDEDEAIKLSDQHGNSIVMSSDGITLESASDLSITSSGDLTLEAGGALELKAGTDLKGEGASGVEISSSATLKISGSLVEIN